MSEDIECKQLEISEYECVGCKYSETFMREVNGINPICPVCYDKFIRHNVSVMVKV